MANNQNDRLDEYILGDNKDVHSEVFLQHALRPVNAGNLSAHNGFASLTSLDGSAMEIWLRINDDFIEKATFWTDGCGTTIACGSMTAELAEKLTVIQAMRLTATTIEKALGGIPAEGCTCAKLAADTLHAAIRDYLEFKHEPWRRRYQREMRKSP